MKLGERPWIDPSAVVEDSELGQWTYVSARASITETIIGDYSYVMNDSIIIYSEIGKFCSIAAHARINPVNHPLWRPVLHHFTYRSLSYGLGEDDAEIFDWRRSQKVRIGNDVWIGHGAIILPGVTIESGAAIGAGSVVTRDVPGFTVVAGNPARQIRRRISEELEAELLSIAWWDWSREKLRDAMVDFRTLDIERFVRKYEEPNEKYCFG